MDKRLLTTGPKPRVQLTGTRAEFGLIGKSVETILLQKELDRALERPSAQGVDDDELKSLRDRLPSYDDPSKLDEVVSVELALRDGDVAVVAVHAAALIGAQIEVMGYPGMGLPHLNALHSDLS